MRRSCWPRLARRESQRASWALRAPPAHQRSQRSPLLRPHPPAALRLWGGGIPPRTPLRWQRVLPPQQFPRLPQPQQLPRLPPPQQLRLLVQQQGPRPQQLQSRPAVRRQQLLLPPSPPAGMRRAWRRAGGFASVGAPCTSHYQGCRTNQTHPAPVRTLLLRVNKPIAVVTAAAPPAGAGRGGWLARPAPPATKHVP